MKRINILLALTLVGLVSGYFLTNSYNFGLCYSDITSSSFDVSCHQSFEAVGNPLFYGSGALALVFLILLFVPKAFPAWKKFAIWFVPLAAILFALYPEPGSGDLFSPYPEQIFRWVSAAYVVISVFIITISVSRKSRVPN